ncbi:hypothetical protein FRB90_000890 [Tulasnella sp. 427]|nr:hypothetical protein FRB90_000890 [Tulasnella sp. 427]
MVHPNLQAPTQLLLHLQLQASIDNLPTEILTLIIEESARSIWFNPTYYASLFEIRGVNRQWKDIVDNAASLWTTIWLELNHDLIKMILVNSKNELLSIFYDDQTYTGLGLVASERITAFLELVSPSAGRWRLLDYQAASDAEHEHMLGLALDELRKLQIRLSGNIRYMSIINAPKLESIDVHRCSLNWSSISALHTLTIDQNTYGPDVDELLTVLRASPGLRRLRVERNWPMRTTGFSPNPSHPPPALIVLPHLESMSFSKLPLTALSILLDQIEAPDLISFSNSMTYKWVSDDFTVIFGSAGRHIGGERGSRGEEDPLELTITAVDDTLRLAVGIRHIALRRFGWSETDGRLERVASVAAALARFHPNLCRAVKSVVFKRTPWTEETLEHLRLVHAALPLVEELLITGPDGETANVESIVDALCAQHEINGWKEVLCPHLVTLRILASSNTYCMRCGTSILRLLENRGGSGQTTPLKALGLDGCRITGEVVEKLKQSLQKLWLTSAAPVDVEMRILQLEIRPSSLTNLIPQKYVISLAIRNMELHNRGHDLFSSTPGNSDAIVDHHHAITHFHIHDLPPELFSLILSQALDLPGSWFYLSYYIRLYVLRRTCKYWTAAIDSTPSLWSYISADLSDDLIARILQNSGTRSLRVSFDDGSAFGPLGSTSRQKAAAFLDRVAFSAERWELLNYSRSYDADHEQILTLPLNNLRTIIITLSGIRAFRHPLHLPSLQHLDIERTSLHWQSIYGLRSLAVRRTNVGPTIEELFTVLRGSPDLESLNINSNWPEKDNAFQRSWSGGPIQLLRLQRLRIFRSSTLAHACLLDHVEIPPTCALSVSLADKYRPRDFAPMFKSAGRHVGERRELDYKDGARVTIAAVGMDVEVSVGARTVELTCSSWLDRQTRQNLILSCLQQFDRGLSQQVQQIHLALPWNDEGFERLQKCHSEFPNIKELEISGLLTEDPFSDPILAALIWSSEPTSGLRLFPTVRSLELKLDRTSSSIERLNADVILSVVESRKLATEAMAIQMITLSGCKMQRTVVESLQSSLESFQLDTSTTQILKTETSGTR